MTRETATMALRYLEMRREYEALRVLPGVDKDATREAKQNVIDARETLAVAIGKESDEVGTQVLFIVSGNHAGFGR